MPLDYTFFQETFLLSRVQNTLEFDSNCFQVSHLKKKAKVGLIEEALLISFGVTYDCGFNRLIQGIEFKFAIWL
jgi:hypothetical protein